jgi:hypothetical protein
VLARNFDEHGFKAKVAGAFDEMIARAGRIAKVSA